MEHDAAHQLYVENHLPKGPPGRLANQGEGLRKQLVQGFSPLVALPEFGGLLRELPVFQGKQFRLGDGDRYGRNGAKPPSFCLTGAMEQRNDQCCLRSDSGR